MKKAVAVLFVTLGLSLAVPSEALAGIGQSQAPDRATQTKTQKKYLKNQKKTAKKMEKSQEKAQKQAIKLHESGH